MQPEFIPRKSKRPMAAEPSGEDGLYQFAVNVREPEIASLKTVGQALKLGLCAN